MKRTLIPSIALLGFAGTLSTHAELLVYEPFDYISGSDVTTPLNGGTGFADAWAPGQQGGVITVYDETAATVTNDNSAGELTWDGVVNNVPTNPAVGSRFISTGADGTADRITAIRTLSQSAGTLAGDDDILWASVVWHQQGSNFGRHVGFALGTEGLSNRSQNVDNSGDAIGVGGDINTGLVTPVIFDNGAIAVRTTTGATTVSYSLDNLVVLKFTFADGATADTVTAYRFTEDDDLLEAAFNTNAISASSVIDQDTLDILSFSQSRGQEAIDEIRLGDTFEDVITGTAGDPREPLEITDIAYDEGSDEITLTWKSNPGETYGIYWSEDPSGFEPGVDPAVPAHATENRTTYGPFANPSPGAPSVFLRLGPPDLEDPALQSLWGNAATVSLRFSEAMHTTAATDPFNFTVQAEDVLWPITSAALSPDGRTITLTTGSALVIGTSYTVTMNNLTDLAGRPLGNPTVGNFQTWDNNPSGVKVFILAGQSNMVGHGKSELGNDDDGNGSEDPGAIGSLRYLAVNDTANYGHLLVDPGQPATSDWATRSDVKVWWRDSDIGATRAVLKGDLGIGFAQSRNSAWFGPEYGFGWVLGDYYTEPVLLIKTAWGGKSLHVDFRPPSAVAARGGSVGPYYTGMIEYVRDVLSNLGTEFPDWTGLGYQIAGFGWHQGWNDGGGGAPTADYEVNLVDLINDLRAEFGNPDLPISIANTGIGGVSVSGNRLTIINAQLAVADPLQHPEFDGTVFTADTRPFYREASVSPSSLGFHWNHNAESHFLIGDAMGVGMEDLLTP